MKAIKTLMAVSVLAAAGAANATVWNVDLSTSVFFQAASTSSTPHTNFTMAYTGTWDDATNTGVMTGVTQILDYGVVLNLTQNFTMNEATGLGSLIKVGATSPGSSCTDNNASPGASCTPFTALLKGNLYNNINLVINGQAGVDNQTNASTPGGGFVPADGLTLTWTSVIAALNNDTSLIEQYTLPISVTLHSQTPAVPVPAAAWLFGSGLLGLAGTARRRRSA